MPAKAAATPDSDRMGSKSYSSKKGRASNAKAASPEPQPESDQEMDEEGDEDEEEEEYEIEAILGDDIGQFPDGRTGYFVKWKGYPSSQNSWVDEKDAGNAHDLIDAYWRTKRLDGKKKAARESRNSMGKTTSTKQKRSKPDEPSESEGVMEEGSEEEVPAKKPRKSTGASNSTKAVVKTEKAPPAKKGTAAKKKEERKVVEREVEEDDDEADDMEVDQELDDMSKYQHLKSWEKLIKGVDTVERTEDDELVVYFRLNSGMRAMQSSSVCKEKFPKKLIDFYESNLRWKQGDAEAE